MAPEVNGSNGYKGEKAAGFGGLQYFGPLVFGYIFLEFP